ncbi:MAG: hypothetical protein ACT4TC_02505 [Myxococcaceae bacterium]
MSDTRVGRSRTANLTLVEKDQLETAVSSLDGRADEQLGGKLNIVSRFLTRFTTRDESITTDVAAAKKALEVARADGTITAEEADLIESKVREAEREINGFASFKRNVADVASVGAALAVGAAAAPLGLTAVGIATAGGALNVVTHAAVQGRGYSLQNLGIDAVTGGAYAGVAKTLGAWKFAQAVLPSVLGRAGVIAAGTLGVSTATDASLDSLGWSVAEPAKPPPAELPREDKADEPR